MRREEPHLVHGDVNGQVARYGPRRGGEATKQRHGQPFYEEIGKRGGEATKRRHGPEFYEEIGRKGGETVKRERGSEFYEEIGKKGGQKVRRLVEEGKKTAG